MGSKAIVNIQSKVQKERSPFIVPSYQMTAANFDAWHTAWGTLKGAAAAICAGILRDEITQAQDLLLDATIPTDNYARRELKLLIRYRSNTSGKDFRSEFPCPDLSVLTFETGDANFVVLADGGVMAAFVGAYEAFARSPDNAENVTIQSVQVVGRNL